MQERAFDAPRAVPTPPPAAPVGDSGLAPHSFEVQEAARPQVPPTTEAAGTAPESVEAPRVGSTPAVTPEPAAVASDSADSLRQVQPTAEQKPQQAEGGAPLPSRDAAPLQTAVVKALLNTKGQTSAAEQLEDAIWSLQGSTLEIQTTLSKRMLPVVINAEADRILKATLRDLGAGPLQVKLLPGEALSGNATPKKPRAAAAGSAAELAEKHPLVQEAKRLFAAELSNVIDLRKE